VSILIAIIISTIIKRRYGRARRPNETAKLDRSTSRRNLISWSSAAPGVGQLVSGIRHCYPDCMAVPPSSTSISLSGVGSSQVQVVTTGTVNVLVTNAGGDIKLGDYITISPIAGVGQRVGDTSTRVIGTAQADFNGSGEGVTKRSINIGSGAKEVAIGQIPVVVAVSAYTATEGKQPYVIPNWLQSLSNTLAGKAVSPLRVIIAAIILIVSLLCISVLLYAAVRNSIISIGRNPLSRGSVLRGLFEVMAIVVGILAVTAVAMYLVIAR
jgi:hypothetical protein